MINRNNSNIDTGKWRQRLSSQLWSREPGKLSYGSANLSQQGISPKSSPCMLANKYHVGTGSNVIDFSKINGLEDDNYPFKSTFDSVAKVDEEWCIPL